MYSACDTNTCISVDVIISGRGGGGGGALPHPEYLSAGCSKARG